MSRGSLSDVLLVFGWLGIVSVGGGLAILPEMHRQLVGVHGFVGAREFADGYAIGQLAPGPNMLAVVFYGYAVAGVVGGLLAALAMIAPGALLAGLAGRVWSRLEQNRVIAWLRRGLVPVGLGLMAGGVAIFARDTLTEWPRVVVALAVLAAVVVKKVHPALAVLAAGCVGAALELLAPA